MDSSPKEDGPGQEGHPYSSGGQPIKQTQDSIINQPPAFLSPPGNEKIAKPNGKDAASDAAPGATAQEWNHWSTTLSLAKHLLPVVSNPHATISPESTIQDLGKVPSIYNGRREVRGIQGWTKKESTNAEIQIWRAEPDYGICLQGRAVRAIDVDISDKEGARRVRGIIERHCHLPVRSRKGTGKFLMPFRFAEPFSKSWIQTAHGKIEILGDGQQFVVAGQHKDGTRYEWESGLPVTIPELTPEVAAAVFDALDTEVGTDSALRKKPSARESVSASGEYVPPETIRELRSALNSMRADDYDQWVRIGLALKTLPGDIGRALWLDWSSTSEKYDPATASRKWDSFKPIFTHWRSVFSEAQERGWVNPMATPPGQDKAPLHEATGEGAKPAPNPVGYSAAQPRTSWDVPYLIKGWLVRGEITTIFGDSQTMKSFLELDMALHVAAGIEWAGCRVKQGASLIILGEGAGSYDERIEVWFLKMAALGYSDEVLVEARKRIWIYPQAVDLYGDPKTLARAIEEAESHMQIKVDNVLIDTLITCLGKGDESSNSDAGALFTNVRKICGSDRSVSFVHHSGHGDKTRERGAYTLIANADYRGCTTRDWNAMPQTVTLIHLKTKRGRLQEPRVFEWDVVRIGIDSDGDPVDSLVMAYQRGVRPIVVNKAKGPNPTERAIATLHGALLARSNAKDGPILPEDEGKEILKRYLDPDQTKKPSTMRMAMKRAIDQAEEEGTWYLRSGGFYLTKKDDET